MLRTLMRMLTFMNWDLSSHVLRPKSRVLRRLDNGLSTVSGVAGNLLCRNDFNPSQQQLFRNQHTFREDFQMYGSLKTVGLSLPITFCYLSNKYPLDMATHETPIKLGWTYPQLVVLILLAKSTSWWWSQEMDLTLLHSFVSNLWNHPHAYRCQDGHINRYIMYHMSWQKKVSQMGPILFILCTSPRRWLLHLYRCWWKDTKPGQNKACSDILHLFFYDTCCIFIIGDRTCVA